MLSAQLRAQQRTSQVQVADLRIVQDLVMRGVNSCPNLSTKMDKSCVCRPHSVGPVSDSSVFRQVKE
jgi:hypothetical protein